MTSPFRPGRSQDAKEEESPRVRELADLLLGGARVHCDVIVPRTEVTGRMRLLSRAEIANVKASTREHFAGLKMPVDPALLMAAGLLDEWNTEIAVRYLAVAVRDPNDESKPLAETEDWRDLDDDQIAAVWRKYQDHEDRLDPMNPSVALTEEDRANIERLAKKGEASLLMPYGSLRLATYLTTSGGPPPS